MNTKKIFFFALLLIFTMLLLILSSDIALSNMVDFNNQFTEATTEGLEWGKEYGFKVLGFIFFLSILMYFFNKA